MRFNGAALRSELPPLTLRKLSETETFLRGDKLPKIDLYNLLPRPPSYRPNLLSSQLSIKIF